MAKQVILAVAGAGKTYHICHSIDHKKKNLILAFTHENINNIQKELCHAFGKVPQCTTISTFDAFVYRELILPYEPSIGEHFSFPKFRSNGICMIDPPRKTFTINGKCLANPKYKPKNQFAHYITPEKQYYCANLSELILHIKKNGSSLIKRLVERIRFFYDNVLIDEFQDFREFDYDLIIKLSQRLENVTLVGDFFQHSVSGTNNSGKPFKKKSTEVSYNDFVDELRSLGFDIDTKTLTKSRRCSNEVCRYVSDKLGIEISSSGLNQGSVFWIDKNADDILRDEGIVKLVYNDAAKYRFRAMNWSYSKGATLGAVCVILTKDFENLAKDSFTTTGIPASTINKLYVAMTRSCGNLFLMKHSTFQRLRNYYKK